MTDILLEVCVDTAEGLEAAIEGGADRIELCSALELGGLTPDPGLMKLAATAGVPVHVMIRPRSGGFVCSQGDERQMLGSIDHVRTSGLAGVVFGALTPEMKLDKALLGRLCRHSSGLDRTLHRAFDCTGPDYASSLAIAISLGFNRVLTSGGQTNAAAGVAVLETLFSGADGRIVIMPGSGITADNAGELASRLPVREIHASCSKRIMIAASEEHRLGFAGTTIRQTSASAVRALKDALRSA